MIERARQSIASMVNASLTLLYWHVGNRIRMEILQEERAEYGKTIVVTLSRQLVLDYGNGFTEKNLRRMIPFLMVCHSQGAIHVRNALLDYPPELRERILVVAIAPAAYIYKETCADVFHYRAEWWRDLVPRFDMFGAVRARDTVITLTSHPSAAAFDHEFISPTYQRELRKHITNYINTNGKML